MLPDDSKSSDSFASLFAAANAGSKQRRLSVGDELEVVVVKKGKDAVFVDLDGKREAFIESADLLDADGKPIPTEVGSKLTVRVAELGGRSGAVRMRPIALHHAQPADGADQGRVEMIASTKDALVVGAKIKGTVTRIESYGAFVQIEGTSDRKNRGLLPLAESTLPRGADPRKHFTVGQAIEAKIVNIDAEGKIRLSTKALVRDEEVAQYEKFSEGAKGSEDGKKRGDRGFGTLGDLLSKGQSKPKKK